MTARIAHLCLFFSLLLIAGCASQPFSRPASTKTPQPQSLAPNILPSASSTSQGIEANSSPTLAIPGTDTPTSGPFTLQFTPIPSDTPLPTIELPTEAAILPALQIWDGLPTYPAESKPDFYFRLRFDPTVWALTTDQYGFPALGHRQISGCFITPSAGRGLALNSSVEHGVRKIGVISYQISTAFVNGVKQFVTYTGGDGNIYTAFRVSFQVQPDQCLADSETVLAELKSVAVFQATPIATP